ncbi:zinc ribbon domain-containing protein [Alcaligenes faecalis]|uniref:FmdB family transcriptional regulator n=2 Tax=Alcaligenes TaxID=507 RepID=A0A2U2BJC9_ALCFA|nr:MULTISPECIES: FmdB family zinc ribbon protein [Alcaligenes]MBX6962648.1 zinc ribbon domain-containing protein [Providencia rettgeri]HCB1211718.1 zinc ribbon domain-containing protein [Klebsiella pneumoniae]ASC90717.1 FmdB family transcriptional regulator [Alcaligenes faecalis]ATI01233.1 FmdB family transcriptional regulator [Alcaligenes faecalis]AYZ90590.1 zinc ribbon domain-containing protein [Alcaligenes faecalis]
MPIYAYKCSSCQYEKDVLQKMSDPVLEVCPECNQPTFTKQVTAAGFQLKGTGWYVTDFRNQGGSKPADSGSTSTPAASTTPSSSSSS